MKGCIGFSSSDSFVSRAIRWMTRSTYSHTFLMLNEDEGNKFILEAGKWDVGINRLKEGKNRSYFMPKAGPVEIQKALDFCLRYIDSSYGYLELFGLAFVLMMRRFGMKVGNPIRTGVICSELVLMYCQILFPDEFGDMDRDAVTPGDMLERIKNSGKFSECCVRGISDFH